MAVAHRSPRHRPGSVSLAGRIIEGGSILFSTLPTEDPDFREIVEEFIARLQDQLAAMQQAIDAQDLQELARLAHWLKGAGGTAGFPAFTQPAKHLESLVQDQQCDEIEAAVAELLQLAERIAVSAAPSSLEHDCSGSYACPLSLSGVYCGRRPVIGTEWNRHTCEIDMSMPEVLYQAKRFRVERVTQESADGSRHAKEIVRHPGAVAIVPLLDDGRICFVENYRVAVGERLVELPAGTLEPGGRARQDGAAGIGRGNRIPRGPYRASGHVLHVAGNSR